MITKNHATLSAEVQKHIAADTVAQGLYWNGHKGCFIGCLAHSSDAKVLQDRFGLPMALVRICEYLFEVLPEGEAKAFFAAFPESVGRDGKDLSRVHWAFLASELRALPKTKDDVQAVIDPVIEGMENLKEGEEWGAAYAAVRLAVAIAADDAAVKFRQRDTILKLISEAA